MTGVLRLLERSTTLNAIFLLLVGAIGFYARKRDPDEDKARYEGLKRLYEQGIVR